MQQDLFDKHPLPRASFDGAEYIPAFDAERLSAQLRRVFDLMRDGQWRSLDAIHGITGDPHASISARLRDLRKPKFGGHTLESQRFGDKSRGFYKYRLILNDAFSYPAGD